MAAQQIQRRLISQLPGFQIDQRIEHMKRRRIFPDVAAKAGFPQFMPVPAGAADEHRNLAGLV